MTFMDAHEQETPRSTLRESKPSTKFPNFVALICRVIDSMNSSIQRVANQQGWRDASVQDDVYDIVLGSKGELVPGGSSRNTFLAKREC
jgi:hypothetical protein